MKKLSSFVTTGLIVLIGGCHNNEMEQAFNIPTVIPVQTVMQAAVSLGYAADFVVLAGSGIKNAGATTVTGDLGLNPGLSLDGFPPGIYSGKKHINDKRSEQAKIDLSAAYNDVAGRTSPEVVILSGNIRSLVLTPGLYKSISSLEISNGNLTFDGMGNENAIFIIQIASTLTVKPGCHVFLRNGAMSSNIFWQVGSSATFGSSSVFKGTILASQSIIFNIGATLNGRGLARSGTISMNGNNMVRQ
jgi:hypothetical protein